MVNISYLCKSICEPVFRNTGCPIWSPGWAGDSCVVLPPACLVTKFKFPAAWCFWLRLVVPWMVCRCALLFCLTVGETYANFPCAAIAFISKSIGNRTSCLGLWRYFSIWFVIFRLVSCTLSELNGEILPVWSLCFLSELLILIIGGMSAVLSIWRCSVNGYCLVFKSLTRLVSMSSCLIGVSITCFLLLSAITWLGSMFPDTWLMTFFLLCGVPKTHKIQFI